MSGFEEGFRAFMQNDFTLSSQSHELRKSFINPNKGYGVFALRRFRKGERVTVYKGELIDRAEFLRRNHELVSVPTSYMFEFEFKNRQLWYVFEVLIRALFW